MSFFISRCLRPIFWLHLARLRFIFRLLDTTDRIGQDSPGACVDIQELDSLIAQDELTYLVGMRHAA